MAILTHRCRACPHPVDWHEQRHRGYTACPCCVSGRPEPDPQPVVQETFTSPGGDPEPLYVPGSPRNTGSMHATRTCDCDRCHAAYSNLHRA
ncbi:hypothetical protein PZ938_11255 [Luteipulveratus sp. YIM 133132]|uniref:Uncharacterized protein n=1 Tax=Luteipulveratus flavus TaxID=3031728 RepID=A0ABT6C8M4_9MICO|nr:MULTISPECIES: hypothetical protein [unclassified Luteipulveratus]MDE9366184.1 hypothetical protein [Luteipulveratus sp. YIM 133132]MDF8265274.1 hypothetical protein [Luteipulveratus sp. YIM 133296]